MEKKEEITALEQELKTLDSDQIRMNHLIKISELYWQCGAYSECKKYAESASYYARKLKHDESLALACYLMGLADNYLNLYDSALENHQKALSLNKQLGLQSSVAECLNNIGQIYLNTGELSRAKECFEEAVQYHPLYFRAYNNLAVISLRSDEYDKALEYMLQGLSILEATEFPDKERSRLIAKINISEIYLKQNKHAVARRYAEEALALSSEQQGDMRIYGLMSYGNLLLETGKIPEAFTYLNKALELSSSLENRELLKEILFLLSIASEKTGDLESSLNYLKRHLELEKEIYSDNLSRRLAQAQAKYEAENQQLKAQQMIEKASRIASIGAMAAGITHEINQPLCAIKVSADAILYWKKRRSIEFPSDIEDSLKTITEAADLINDIIQHVRSFWQPEELAGAECADVNNTIHSALRLLERQIFSHGIFLELELAEQVIAVRILPTHLEQVIINIIVNAIQALDSRNKGQKKLRILTLLKENEAMIEISDNAGGIKQEMLEKVFDPFFTTKREGKNMGLGLAIVENYIRKYKGKISVSNNTDGGASFTFQLPLVEKDQ